MNYAILKPCAEMTRLPDVYSASCKLLCNADTGSPLECFNKPNRYCHDHCTGFYVMKDYSHIGSKHFQCRSLELFHPIEIIEPKAVKP
jgi:hypothetical protein